MGKTSFSGPAAGAYITIPVCGAAAQGTVQVATQAIPDGMSIRYFAVGFTCTATTAGTIEVGSGADTDGYVTSKAFTANVVTYAPFDGALGTSAELTDDDVVLVTLGGTAITGACVWLYGYVVDHTTNLNAEGE